MGAQAKLFNRLFWLIDTVYTAKRIKLTDINRRWASCRYNDKHEEEYGAFTTTGDAQGVEEVLSNQVPSTKILHNGQVLILRGDKTYTLQGQEVR